jgi:endonuclease YncB( thermonuclease family)
MRKEIVNKVIDGDTFLTTIRTKPVRLADPDTPKKGEKGYG